MIKPHLKNIHCPCRDNSIPQPVPLLTNSASKLELPHVQTIPLLEQFKTVLPPSTISNHLKKSIRVQIFKTPQNLEDLDLVSPQESCLNSSEPQDPQPLLITILPQTLHHPGRPSLHLLQLVYVLPVVRSSCLHAVIKVRPYNGLVQG